MRVGILAALLLLLLGGCDRKTTSSYVPAYSKNTQTATPVYLFGVHPLHNPKRLFEVYQPLVEYLNRRLRHGELKLEASRNYAAYDEKLFSGYFHFALPNPYQTVTAETKGYSVLGKMGDDENFRGIILVRKDSGIREVADLKGKSISYPAPTALAATMMPQWFLQQNGLDVMREATNSYVGSQESSIMNVYLKKSDAAATWPPPWRAFIKERPEIAEAVEVKWQTGSLPNNGLVARNDVPRALVEEVARLLFALHTHDEGRAILSAMELSRFEKADGKTYAPVREFLKIFEATVRPIRSES